MMLLVDIGNTRIKWMLCHRDRVITRGHFVHRDTVWGNLGERLWGRLEPPSQVIIANVAGSDVVDILSHWLTKTWALTPRFIDSQAKGFGVQNAYKKPQQLGVDRWVALIGARTLTQQNCCIVDCGTAVTVDAMNEKGAHLGGVIFPGTRLMREVLYRGTRQITEKNKGNMMLFGDNTRDGVWSGTTYAVAAAIDGISEHMEQTLQIKLRRILTGGNSQRLFPYLQNSYLLEPDLIFHGLRFIAEYENIDNLATFARDLQCIEK